MAQDKPARGQPTANIIWFTPETPDHPVEEYAVQPGEEVATAWCEFARKAGWKNEGALLWVMFTKYVQFLSRLA